MSDVLSVLEQVKAKLMYAVTVGHSFIPVSRIMFAVNRITRLLGHHRPLDYSPSYPQDSQQHKVWSALDDAHQELFDLLHTQHNQVIAKIGESNYEDLTNLLAELSYAKDRAFDVENGPGASLLKRGRRFNVAAIR